MPKLSRLEVVQRLQELGVTYSESDSYSTLLATMKQAETTNAIKEEEKPVPEIVDEQVNQEVNEAVKKEDEVVKPTTTETKKYANPFSSFETKLPMTGKAHEMRKKLMSQPRVPVYIPLGHEEKVGATHQVTLNGYTMFIRKGMQVDVPVQVKEILDEKFAHQLHVRQHPLRVSGGAGNVKLSTFE